MKNSVITLAKRNKLRAHFKATIDPATVPKYKDRLCVDCQEDRPCRWTGQFFQTGQPEYRNRCDEHWNARGRTRTKATRPTLTTQRLDRQYARKQQCIEYLGGRCMGCGYDRCAKSLTFHHRGEKNFGVSQKLDYAWATLQSELDLCDLLCFNCHMERHCDLDDQVRLDLGQPRKVNCSHIKG